MLHQKKKMTRRKSVVDTRPKVYKLKNMVRGWFVGDFEPTIFRTKEAEVALQFHPKNSYVEPHIHKVATEINLMTQGIAVINGVKVEKGDIFVIKAGIPLEKAEYLEDTEMIVVKIPSVKRDKYLWLKGK